MPQLQLPIFYDGVNPISNDVGYEKRDGKIVYFYGSMPVFSHNEDDLASFRTITSQLYVNGNVGQTQIAQAFGIRVQARNFSKNPGKTIGLPTKPTAKSNMSRGMRINFSPVK